MCGGRILTLGGHHEMPPKHKKSVEAQCSSSSPRDEGGMQLAWRKHTYWLRRATATTLAPGRLKTKSVGSLAQKKNIARIKKEN